MIEWIFTVLVLYLLYKLIFDFILPVSRASAQMRNKMNEMSNRQQDNTNQQQPDREAKTRPPKEDYIDFEEIK
jgi:hypothetical protein